KDLVRSRLTDQDHIGVTRDVMLIKIAAGNQRNSPGTKKSRCNVVRGSVRSFRDGRDRPIGARVEGRAQTTNEREIATGGDRFKPRNRAQSVSGLVGETGAHGLVRIAGLRESDKRHPEMIGTKTEILLT